MQFFVIAFLDELGHSEHFLTKKWNLGPDPPLMENSIFFSFFFFEPFPNLISLTSEFTDGDSVQEGLVFMMEGWNTPVCPQTHKIDRWINYLEPCVSQIFLII